MKKVFILIVLLFSITIFSQENFEITTLRIGGINLKMKVEEVEKIAGYKLKTYDAYERSNEISYYGEKINVTISEYIENDKVAKTLYFISTKSKKFKTKSGIGVGNTKQELFDAYKDFQKFEYYPSTDKNTNKYSKEVYYFSLSDLDNNTVLIFKLENNVITEISVGPDESCC